MNRQRASRACEVGFDYFLAIQTEDLGSFNPGCRVDNPAKEGKANMIDELADMSCAKGMWLPLSATMPH
jgi:hypothetical protein